MKTIRRTGLLARTALGSALFIAAGMAQPAFAQSTVAGTVAPTASNGSGPTIGTVGNTTTVTAGSSRTVLNWDSLDLANGETLQYVMADRGNIVLNRVTSGTATIDGAVKSNIGSAAGATGGNVWFSAPGGIVFGGNAVVNVGGLLATTAGISDSAFLAASDSFAFSGAPASSSVDVLSGARINISGGTLALIAPNVRFSGTISDESTGNNSDVLFGAAEGYTITFAADAAGDLDLLSWTVPSEAVGTSDSTPITVPGTVTAGNVYIGAVTKQSLAAATISVSGVLTADGAIASGDGDIILVAGGGISGGAATAAMGGAAHLAVGPTFANRDVGFSAANGNLAVNAQARSGRDYSVTAQSFTGTTGDEFFPYLTTPGGALTINDTAGGLAVGGLLAPGDLSISTTGGPLSIIGLLASNTGNITLNSGADIILDGSLMTSTASRMVSLTAAGAIQQRGGTVNTGTLTGSAGGAFILNSAGNSLGLLSNVSADSISVVEGGGLSVTGAITANNGDVAITVGSGALALNGVTLSSGGAVTLGASVITLSPATITSAGSVTFNAPVQVQGVNSVTSNGGDVTFTGTVNGIGSSGSLTASSAGYTNFQGAIGGTNALNGLTVNGSGTTVLAGDVTTDGTQTYNQAVTLDGAVTIRTVGNAVNFASTVDGAQALTINAPGSTGVTFGGAVGSIVPLASLSAGNIIRINGGSIRTSGTQTYSGNVFLGSNATLTGTAGSFAYELYGGGNDLTLNLSGASVLDGTIIIGVRNFTANGGGTTTISRALTTTGSQTFTDALTLGGNTTLAGTTGSFANGVTGGGNNLTLNYSGTSAISGAFTGIGALTTGGGGTTNLSGTITTSGAQTYNDAVLLTGGTTLNSTGNAAITLGGTVDGAQGLTILTQGTTSFAGAVGGTTPLAALVTNAGGTTSISGGAIRTTGAQTFGDPVTLGANTVFAGSDGSFASDLTGGGNDLTLDYSGAHTLLGWAFTGIRNLAIGGGGTTSLTGQISTTGTQTYSDALSLGAGTVFSLQSSGTGAAGNISLAAVTGNARALNVTSGGDITLNGAIAGVTTLGVNGRAITVDGAISTSGNATLLTSAGDLIVNQPISVAGTNFAWLQAVGGSLLGTGLVTADSVALQGPDGIGTSTARFNVAANKLAARAYDGSLYVQEADSVTLQDVGGFTSIADQRYDIRAASIEVAAPIMVFNGTIALAATGTSPTSGITLNDSLTASGTNSLISLNSGTSISQLSGALIADSLSGSAAGSVSLNSVTNDVARLRGFAAGTGLTYRDANDFIVLGPVSNATSGGITLTAASQTMALVGNITAAGQTVTLNASGGSITQSGGAITAGTLAGFISVDAQLWQANQIDSIGSLIANSVWLNDAGGLRIAGAVQANASAGDVNIRTTGGDLTLLAGSSVSGRNVVLSSDAAFLNQAGGGALSVGTGGHWVIYSAAPGGNTYGGLDSGNVAWWNGTIDTVAASSISGNRYVFAYQPTVTLTTTGGTKVYGTDLSYTWPSYYTVTGLHPGVAGAFNADTSAYLGLPAVRSAGFAERASVAGGPYPVLIDIGSVTPINGYAVSLVSAGTITVTPKALSGTANANGKIYDGTTAATGSIGLTGLVTGDQVAASGSFAFADKNAGTGKTVAISGAALTGADAGNYTLSVPASVVADILQKALTGTATADSKTYDGTTAATGSIGLTGVVTGDQVAASGSFAFADKNAGTGKTVAVSGAALTGADAGNYTLSVPASVVADILQKALTGTATADGKVYDGTAAAIGSIGLAGVVTGDQVAASGSFAFADKNAGTSKTVTVSGTGLTGADAGNYTLSVPASVVADILQKALTGTATADGKVYDGTAAATGSIGLTGVVAGDQVTASGNFAFADKNAGTGKTVTVSGTGLTGADAGNYTLSAPASVVADILQKALTGTAAADNKTYDGTTAATGSIGLTGVVQGDSVSASADFAFVNRDAGAAKTVQVTGAALAGADAGNYTLVVPATAVADILRRAIAVSADPVTKLEGDSDPALGYSIVSGTLVSGDTLTGTPARQAGETPGAYAIGQGTLAASNNYLLTFTGSTLTIQPGTPSPAPTPSPDIRREDIDGFIDFLDTQVAQPRPEPAPLVIGSVEDGPEPLCGGENQPACADANR